MIDEGEWLAGRYRLISRVGTGAMGVVWKARDERLDRIVAVKQLLHADMSEVEAEEANRSGGGAYQVRLFGGHDPVTGKQVMLTGSADDEDTAIKLRDKSGGKSRMRRRRARASRWDICSMNVWPATRSRRPPGRATEWPSRSSSNSPSAIPH